MGEDFASESDLIEASTDPLQRNMSAASDQAYSAGIEEAYKPRGFFGSFGFLLAEQSGNWPWYLLL
jgi:hypothetical protein